MRNTIAAVAAFVPLFSACASTPASHSWEVRHDLPYSRPAGVPVELDLVPRSGHVTLFLLRPAAVERAADFLERRLKGA